MTMTTGQIEARPSTPVLTGTFIVTGASSGLGLAIARAIAAAGGTPVSFDPSPPREAVEFRHEAVDVSNAGAVAEAIDRIGASEAITGIVANAGIDACGRFEDVPFEAWDRVIRVNLVGTAATVRAALPHLRRNGGRIVTVASTLGLRALSDATAYCASKFGVVGFTRALAVELAGQVPVTLLLPGGMQTHFFDGRTEQYKPGPDAQLNDPANVARTVVFALSQPAGCEIREMLVVPSKETSWP